jgi:hypothetical protein
MKTTGEWGQFFPIGTSNFGYNETVAQEYFPITKEEAEKKSLPWWDKITSTSGKETVKNSELPDNIDEVKDSIVNGVLVCTCGKNYKIVPYELSLYRKLGVPLPRECPNCRHERRNILSGNRALFYRQCIRNGCQNKFETTYSPDRPEIVYCEKCYQQEVY